jgi:hypothetical protein
MSCKPLSTSLLWLSALGLIFTFTGAKPVPPKDDKYYEMRIYYAAAGKLDALQSRFRNHTTKIFEKNGMTNVGYWIPVENTNNTLVYILAYPSKESRDKAWKAFGSDPEWKKIQSESEANGKLVDSVKSIFMKATDYSPKIAPVKSKEARVFELRTYTTHPGKLPDLHTRFREHTMKLFKKHGMTNIAYWEVINSDGSEPHVLTYLLAHKSKEAADKSFADFRADPQWQQVQKASEANGPIVKKRDSQFLTPTDYSPIQ